MLPPATTLSAPSELVKSLFDDALSKLYPSDLALETFNSQYLQKNGENINAVLAAARASKLLKAPVEEVEGTVLSVLEKEALTVQVRSCLRTN